MTTTPRLWLLSSLALVTLYLAVPSACLASPQDGYQSGVSEGAQRGGDDGGRQGRCEGRHHGYTETLNRLEEAASSEARQQGMAQGSQQGREVGASRGNQEGQQQGATEGSADGHGRANRDAQASVQDKARADGLRQATDSDAGTVGRQQGTAAGQQQAEQRALSYDREQGQEEYRRQRFAEPVKTSQSLRQGRVQPPQSRLLLPSLYAKLGWLSILGCAVAPSCNADGRYCRPTGSAAEMQAYRCEYERGFQSSYRSHWQGAYEAAYQEAYRCGCREAEGRDYQSVFREALECARSNAYQAAYPPSFESARQQAYARAFQENSQRLYTQNYPRYQQEHYQRLREEAYHAEYERLRLLAFEPARSARYSLVYAGLAQRERRLGRTQQKLDFDCRPVRLLEWTSEPSEIQDVYLTTVSLRNFSSQAVSGKQVRLCVKSPGPAEWLTQDTLLLSPLNPLGSARVTGALRYSWSGKSPLQATLEATYLGTNGWVSLGTLELSQPPAATVGLPTQVK